MFLSENTYFCPLKSDCDETKKRIDMPLAQSVVAVWVVCGQPIVEGHAQGRAANGEAGEAKQETIQEGEGCPL